MSIFYGKDGFKNPKFPWLESRSIVFFGAVLIVVLWSEYCPTYQFARESTQEKINKRLVSLPDTIPPHLLSEAAPTAPEKESPDIFSFVEEMPEYKDGEAGLLRYVAENIRFSAIPKDSTTDIPSKFTIEFVVEVNGEISNLKARRGDGGVYEEEIIRVIKSTSGKWKSGKMSGVPVRVRFVIPLNICYRG